MLVGDRMNFPVVTISPDMPIHEALGIMKCEKIRHIPVLEHGKLVGIVENEDLILCFPFTSHFLEYMGNELLIE